MNAKQERILRLLIEQRPVSLRIHWHPITKEPDFAYVGNTKVDKRAAATLCRTPYLHLLFSTGGKLDQTYMPTRTAYTLINEQEV